MRRLPVAVLLASVTSAACQAVATQEPVQLVYSEDVSDPWNRLFNLMFTRTVRHRKTSEFPDAAPFSRLGENEFTRFTVSKGSFERFEDGDRAVAPFYPSSDYLFAGSRPQPLRDPRIEMFAPALQEALADARPRTPVDRVLMQTDLWAMFDRLGAGDPLLPLLARLMTKVAPTRDEVAALPDHYALARQAIDLPDLFSPGSPWQEVVWADQRIHDFDARFRQATRVFVRPSNAVKDRRSFFDDLRLFTSGPHQDGVVDAERRGREAFAQIAGVALVMQLLAVDRQGDILPTPLVFTVQTRMFAPGPEGKLTTIAAEHELSRQRLRAMPSTGGLRTFTDRDPAYVPAAGNDYGFASPHLGAVREPVLGTLSTRCFTCHGSGPQMFTFSLHQAPTPATVRLLAQPNETRVRFVIEQKKARDDYKRLRALWLVTRNP